MFVFNFASICVLCCLPDCICNNVSVSLKVRNVQHLIKLTEDNLKELNSLKRSGLSHPPSIFFEVSYSALYIDYS